MRLPRADERGLDLLGGRWTKCSRAWPPRSATIARCSLNARKAATRSVRLASERLGWDSEARHAGAATDELVHRKRKPGEQRMPSRGRQGTPLPPNLAGGIGEGTVSTAGGPADVVPARTRGADPVIPLGVN